MSHALRINVGPVIARNSSQGFWAESLFTYLRTEIIRRWIAPIPMVSSQLHLVSTVHPTARNTALWDGTE